MYAILDIETTGGKYNEEGITEIAIYKYDGHEVVDQFISLVNPEREIQPFVVNLTGINSNMLRHAPKFYEVAKRIVEITEDCIVVAHNAQFDNRILKTEFRRLGFDFERKTLCTVELAKDLIPGQTSYSLGKLVRSLGIPVTDRHRASGDALATVKLFKMLLDKDTSKNIIQQSIRLNPKHQLEPKHIDIIEQMRDAGWVWGINTGRSQMQTTTGFMESKFPFLPDFLIAREREIYTPGQFGRWVSVKEWNTRSEKDHKKMFRKSKRALKEIRAHVESETQAEWISEEGDPAGVVATSVEEMAEIISMVDPYVADSKILGYLRNTIYMRFSHRDYHKGTSLAEVARRCGVEKEQVFAIGDGHNDLDMLDRTIADMIACPANADDEVKQHITANGGYVSKQSASNGVVEALAHFFE